MRRFLNDAYPFRQLLLSVLLLFSGVLHALDLSLELDDMVAPDFSARGIALSLPQDGSAELNIAMLHIGQRELRKVKLRCASFDLSTAAMSCRGGSLASLPGATLDFSYRIDNGAWQFSSRLRDTPAKMLAIFLPDDLPRFTQGALSGSLQAAGEGAGVSRFSSDLRLADIGFSDASGLHAAEKLRGVVKMDGTRKAGGWQWKSDIAWQSGEMFWQPLYLGGSGQRLRASGTLDKAQLNIAQAELDQPAVGTVRFSVRWDKEQGKLIDAVVQGEDIGLERLFADYAKPFLDKSALAEASLSGRADLDWRYREGATQRLHLALRKAGISDARQRFSLEGVDTDIDWQPEVPRSVDIALDGASLLGVPFGNARWRVRMNGMQFDVDKAMLPTLGGRLEVNDLHMRREQDDWRWEFGAMVSNIPMQQFSRALGWPEMLGTLAGRIPRVSYDGKEIRTDGALLFSVFDGTVVASRLRLAEPFGRAPRLFGNLSMRSLDLDLLTRTFAFGNMQGRIDADVGDLELQNWKPARFDARIASSQGNYPKKISQRAVQNISSLGGAGAAAAIQRSYLRFFENFGYDSIGWRCVLRNGVCAMGGVDAGNVGPYAIVKGGGIPAITVMGYNRTVSWNELVSRLKRVTQNNVQAVVN
ncbi:MAG: hypothetical protein U1C96_05140 [Gallionella sp.]|nr:hypothetical protein [Gallionella sp.]